MGNWKEIRVLQRTIERSQQRESRENAELLRVTKEGKRYLEAIRTTSGQCKDSLRTFADRALAEKNQDHWTRVLGESGQAANGHRATLVSALDASNNYHRFNYQENYRHHARMEQLAEDQLKEDKRHNAALEAILRSVKSHDTTYRFVFLL